MGGVANPGRESGHRIRKSKGINPVEGGVGPARGLGVTWPQSDLDIALLLVFYGLAALMYIALERRSQRATLKVVIAQ